MPIRRLILIGKGLPLVHAQFAGSRQCTQTWLPAKATPVQSQKIDLQKNDNAYTGLRQPDLNGALATGLEEIEYPTYKPNRVRSIDHGIKKAVSKATQISQAS